MNEKKIKIFPSDKNIWISLLILVVIYNLFFIIDLKKEFHQFQYDWTQVKEIKRDSIKILEISKDYLKIKTISSFSPDAKYTYLLEDGNNRYYFRFEYRVKRSNIISFYDVNWIKGIPFNVQKYYTVNTLVIPRRQEGKYKILTVGDELFCRGHAEEFRKNLSKKSSVIFIGQNRDVYNFPHLAFDKNSSSHILNSLSNSKADGYILFFKWHKNKESWEQFKENLEKINKIIIKKHPKHFFWITLLFTGNKETDDIYAKINKLIYGLSGDVAKIIDSNLILGTSSKKKYYDVDGNLSKSAYILLSNEIAKKINDRYEIK